MKRKQFAELVALLCVVLLVALLGIATGEYADWASCKRNNTQRSSDREISKQMTFAASQLDARAGFDSSAKASANDHKRAQHLRASARRLAVRDLKCTVPFPQVS